jgi:predicted glycosyltransferase
MSRPPVLVYCQHLLGIGHAQRTARLVRALAAAGERVVFVNGGRAVGDLDLGPVRVEPLPPLQAGDEAVSTLVTPEGAPPDAAYLGRRRDRLLGLLAGVDPAVAVLELFPFGRHALAFELGPLLLALEDDRRRRGAAASRVAVSVRDVLVSRRNPAWQELAAVGIVQAFVDRVLVHGSPDVVPFERTFGLAARLGDRLVYTGYLAPPPAAGPVARHGAVVVSGGGGQVARPLFEAVLDARPWAPAAAGRPWRLLTGPYYPAGARAPLAARAAALAPVGSVPAVTVERFQPDLPALLAGAALSVSQAGYNTLLDVVASRVRAVVVPYEGSGDEQPVRARLLADRGLVRLVPAGELTARRLGEAMEEALAAPGFPAPARLDLGGVARSVQLLGDLVAGVAAARRAAGAGAREEGQAGLAGGAGEPGARGRCT